MSCITGYAKWPPAASPLAWASTAPWAVMSIGIWQTHPDLLPGLLDDVEAFADILRRGADVP